ncbi:MAG: NAD+ synthase (glutamine-hydrolyzing) [Myxococcota bacterium]|jgi:NAD+ synthase (glutamine-hydrolysing)
MNLIKVGAGALNQTPLDWDNNTANILEAIRRARTAGVSLLCLPELCVTGYGCEDAFLSPDIQATALDILMEEILPATEDLIVCVGVPVMYENCLFNTAAICCDGALLGFVAKQFLAGDGLHYEPRWFRAWQASVQGTVTIRGEELPIGDLHFDCGGVRIGVEVCEDAWVPLRPGGWLAQRGVDVILNPSASHFAFGKRATRERVVLEGSRAFGVTYVYTNLLGNEAGRAIYDGDAQIASAGELLANSDRLTLDSVTLTTAVVDVDATRQVQARTASFRPEMDDDETDRIVSAFGWPDTRLEPRSCDLPSWEDAGNGPTGRNNLKCEEFTRAVSLGLWDYMRKAGTDGFVVSLSGGADSAAVTVLSALALKLGGKTVAPHLTTVYQGTRNSSRTTLEAARAVADAVGATFHEFEMDGLVDRYRELATQAQGRELTWETDDIALQNIQARVRGPSVWMLANIERKLLLATSNRSEAAVGYATMDGDTCGSLSPIAGIDKAFLRDWLLWMQTEGPEGIGPLPELEAVTRQAPTAELRPHEYEQTDEKDLMPYPVLDAIEEVAIGGKNGPMAVYRHMQQRFPQYDPEMLLVWVERFFALWCRNQWKRERYAPSFHVDDRNLDPKSWCRFPILSGGYRRELTALRAHVEETLAHVEETLAHVEETLAE